MRRIRLGPPRRMLAPRPPRPPPHLRITHIHLEGGHLLRPRVPRPHPPRAPEVRYPRISRDPSPRQHSNPPHPPRPGGHHLIHPETPLASPSPGKRGPSPPDSAF